MSTYISLFIIWVSKTLHLICHPFRIHRIYLILLTNSLKSPPSTHFSSPPPPTPKPPPDPPPPTPHPSPTSPITRAGWPPTTDPEAMTMFVGTTVCGSILTFSLIIAKGWIVTLLPMWTCEEMEMAEMVLLGPFCHISPITLHPKFHVRKQDKK
jgi:hypothetical protein